MAPLPTDLRKSLDRSVVDARDAAEDACRAALAALGVEAREAPQSLDDEQRQLRVALRAQQRQLGGEFEQLVAECAYEQWHLMLFARFLAENDLLIHPELRAPVSLEEVAELARDLGESDPWLLAARFAAAMLPGIFKPADPCVRLPLAPEGRRALEDVLTALPPEVFTADDALGWVYQFWQTKKKKEVNASERKIGGADLAPVTQLFTEDYMVRFLLENSLGAWWATRHPQSPLLAGWEHLRFADDGTPAAGRFDGWPETVAKVTVMDPCCGSGHFLVAAFEMLRRMREEEEGITTREAVDAVLRENLYGLELDARCVQLGAFNLALAAWKASGYHELPLLSLACCGIPTRGSLEEWTKLAKGDERLERALARLHELFREADTLGSLIDPRRAVEDGSLMSVPFEEVAPLLERALASDSDPVAAVFGDSAREVARAATFLAGSYTLVATNPPYLGRRHQSDVLMAFADQHFADARHDLATMFLDRSTHLLSTGARTAQVLPQAWTTLGSFKSFRSGLLSSSTPRLLARLGSGAFDGISGEVVKVGLFQLEGKPPVDEFYFGLDCSNSQGVANKADSLRNSPLVRVGVGPLLMDPDRRVTVSALQAGSRLESVAQVYKGLTTGDDPRFRRGYWEQSALSRVARLQSGSEASGLVGGCQYVLLDQDLKNDPPLGYRPMSTAPLRHLGVAVGHVGTLRTVLYLGVLHDQSVASVIPLEEQDLLPILAFCGSPEFAEKVREIDSSIKVTEGNLAKVSLALPAWREIAREQYPSGLPEPHSDDPTQWLFRGSVIGSEQPLHVALARLLGYRWPDQEQDELDRFADEDGIVCLPPLAGERPAHERLRDLLAAAYRDAFSQQTVDELLSPEGSGSLEDWLRDKAFASHARLFHTRPFIWHVWDGRKDGFAALVNYHRLDHQALQKLTFSHLNWWIDRQKADAAADVAGADARLAAAVALQEKLKLILDGEAPRDIYVRWKSLAEQPLGWQPDLDDGVRLNIRPFVEAGVLRSKLNIHWKKDRGKNPDGSERLNDLHYTLAEKRAAREERERDA